MALFKRNKKLITSMGLSLLISLSATTAFADVPAEDGNLMYATSVTPGNSIENVKTSSKWRLNPENALMTFDATQVGNDAHFYSLASHESTTYTFTNARDISTKKFFNVRDKADIRFKEITWGKWHVEAAKVYLTNAYIRTESGDIVKYEGNDDGHGYYAGVVWNKVGLSDVPKNTRDNIQKSYAPQGSNRQFVDDNLSQNNNFAEIGFNLPEEVVYAEGVTLVDITKDVHDKATTNTWYSNYGYKALKDGEVDDGFDLDAISVYTSDISVKFDGDSATGYYDASGENAGDLPGGNWFMYNKFSGDSHTYNIVAGNPKKKANIVGTYTVTKNSNGTYTATYNINETTTRDGKEYRIVVTEEHLGLSDTDFTTSAPGQLDNANFGDEFTVDGDTDGVFNVFAHFTLKYIPADL